MNTCPYCGHENEAVAKVCSACNTDLAAPPVEGALEDPNLNLVVLARFRNVVEAGMLKSWLEASGIECCVPEEYSAQIFWKFFDNSVEPVTVRVAAKDFEEAKTLLAQYRDSANEAEAVLENESAAPTPPAEAAGSPENRIPCVACSELIPASASVCPECGWTQPAAGENKA